MQAKSLIDSLNETYPQIWQRLNETITPASCFDVFKQLSDNYSPTLTVSRVQGQLVESLLSDSNVTVDHSLRQSGSIGITIGQEPAPVWMVGHADICSYLTQPMVNGRYPLIPFCVPRAEPGPRPAVALGNPKGSGSLEQLATGMMVTDEDGSTHFETDVTDLPSWTRVVYSISAEWNQDTDEAYGYVDNQATCAALIAAARVLTHYDVNVLMVLNDEEEGPVDKGNQGFSRAMLRLLNRTPLEQLPEFVINADVGQQETRIASDLPLQFGKGALFTGDSSNTRGAVVPPQILDFTRDFAEAIAPHGVKLIENPNYTSRSDDIAAMQFTQNVALFAFPATSAHFDKTPTIHAHDLAELAKVFALYALVAQDEAWRDTYL